MAPMKLKNSAALLRMKTGDFRFSALVSISRITKTAMVAPICDAYITPLTIPYFR